MKKKKTEFQEWRSTMAKLDNKLRKAEERRKKNEKVAAVSDAKKQASFMKAKQNVQGN